MKKGLGSYSRWENPSKGSLLGCCGHLARMDSTYGICSCCCTCIEAGYEWCISKTQAPYEPHACGIWNIAHLCYLLSGAGHLVSNISALCSISHMRVACKALASYLYTTYTPLIYQLQKNYICHKCYKSLPSDRNNQAPPQDST